MIPTLRQQELLDLLRQNKKIYFLTELVELLGVSESTLRRDLKTLTADGSIRMLRGGGVCLAQGDVELDMESKLNVCLEEKKRIARYAATMIQPGDIVFMDPSSICYLMIDYLTAEKITVVTNSCANAIRLLKQNIPCIMIGGQTKKGTFACIGSMASELMGKLWFNKCFLGANGITEQFGITNHDPDECSIKRLAIKRSNDVCFLVNSAKAGVMTMCQVAPIDRYRVLMEQPVDALRKYSNIITVPEDDAEEDGDATS